MSKSPVTEYMIAYLEENHVSPEDTARVLGIDEKKLKPDYPGPLDAEEFLELCVYLGICPEQVAQGIRKDFTQQKEK